ncbi:hypothetical protein EPUS_04559 [Endocarpon pusillum Z07020]|uniref:Mid2 domain-containing protein n=1 Tax=Endocarpon pusillum (strain Z07020 / HMAS-L-300199) TaxID=1263415 RepID=U1I112_ENDPU|nr:uncharacterized protein EPUS_04559 [Endocarpon pusillum Z07020]ERF75579.1 hypothetical protein EPUS_04559 [Endocarpon pusillum Z07020]
MQYVSCEKTLEVLDANLDTADQSLPDVVYSYTSNLWQCCGTDENNAVTCGTPTSQTFNAPPPAQLRAAFSSSASLSTGSTTSTSSPSSSSILTANASATSSSEGTQASESGSDSGLSGGAIAGVVIGALAGIVLVAGLAFWLGRRRRRIRNSPAHGTPDANMLLNTYANHKPALKPYSDRPAQELHSMHTTELQGES